jgi:hypothetical protein
MTPLDFESDLDRALDRQLQELPGQKAPATLLPRVMAAVAHGSVAARTPAVPAPAPWYLRPWLTWPRALRVASAAAVIVTVAAFVTGAPILQWLSPSLAADFARLLDPFQSVGRLVGQAATLTRVFWHVWLEPIALYLLALVVLLSLAVTAALSVVNRLTPERT